MRDNYIKTGLFSFHNNFLYLHTFLYNCVKYSINSQWKIMYVDKKYTKEVVHLFNRLKEDYVFNSCCRYNCFFTKSGRANIPIKHAIQMPLWGGI